MFFGLFWIPNLETITTKSALKIWLHWICTAKGLHFIGFALLCIGFGLHWICVALDVQYIGFTINWIYVALNLRCIGFGLHWICVALDLHCIGFGLHYWIWQTTMTLVWHSVLLLSYSATSSEAAKREAPEFPGPRQTSIYEPNIVTGKRSQAITPFHFFD